MQPIVAVCGSTAVGKSQLAVDLALHLQRSNRSDFKEAEVINADAMQVYTGLPRITNKVTEEEKCGVTHHLMDFLHPWQEYRVDRFEADAISLIDDLQNQQKLPILAGGTSYYVQHLLFAGNLVAEDKPESEATCQIPSALLAPLPKELIDLLLLLPDLPPVSSSSSFPADFPSNRLPPAYNAPESFSIGLFELLRLLDPATAQRLHWKDVRKIRRSLQIFMSTGRRQSDIHSDQQSETRYDALVFWLYAEPSRLDERLDKRVDKMVKNGLLDEILELRQIAKHSALSGSPTDYSKGIYQAIGFKEFSDYFDAVEAGAPTENVESRFNEGLEAMKLATRQYARKQVKWMKNQMVPSALKSQTGGEAKKVLVYVLDATNLDKWNERARDQAVSILDDFLEQRPLPDPVTLNKYAPELFESINTVSRSKNKITCELCTTDPDRPVLLEEGAQWEQHLKSRGHRKSMRAGGKTKKQLWEEYQQTLRKEGSESEDEKNDL